MLHYGDCGAKHALLFLHGHGQTAANARSLFKKTVDKTFVANHSLVVFFPSRQWYKYVNDVSHDYDEKSLYETRTYIHKVLHALESKHERVVLGGYSQGASVAMDAAETYSKLLPVVSIAGFLLRKGSVLPGQDYKMRTDPYILHGDDDDVVPLHLLYKSLPQKHVYVFRGSHWGFWQDVAFRTYLCDFLHKHTRL